MKLRECETDLIMQIIFPIMVKRFQVHCSEHLEIMYSKTKITYSNDPSTFTPGLSGTSKTGNTEVALSLLTLTLLAESGVSS